MSQPKQCPKCKVLISKPGANYCRVHAGKNPMISKEYEENLVNYIKKHYPGMLK